MLLYNATNYSKGILSEILDFVMGQGLIPADGEVWKVRRRVIVPALHKRYLAAMLDMFGDCAQHGADMLEQSHRVSVRHGLRGAAAAPAAATRQFGKRATWQCASG